MSGGRAWAGSLPDPTAGVTLAPKRLLCPRCGLDKGTSKGARPGLCIDCRDVLYLEPPEVRAAWRRAA